jgi:hypothetical protein
MRAGRAGLKELAPPPDLFDDFRREKAAGHAHLETFRRVRYRERYLRAMRESHEAMRCLRALVDEARSRDLYLMCMCPYRAEGEACHTYLLLELAREIDPRLAILTEPRPRARRSASAARRGPASRSGRAAPRRSSRRTAS